MGIVSSRSHVLQHLSDIDGLAPRLPGHAIPNWPAEWFNCWITRLNPDFGKGWNNLGCCLVQSLSIVQNFSLLFMFFRSSLCKSLRPRRWTCMMLFQAWLRSFSFSCQSKCDDGTSSASPATSWAPSAMVKLEARAVRKAVSLDPDNPLLAFRLIWEESTNMQTNDIMTCNVIIDRYAEVLKYCTFDQAGWNN